MRKSFGSWIAQRLREERESLQRQWIGSGSTRHFIVDDLFPEDQVKALFRAFPSLESLVLRRSLRERKRVGVNLNRYDPLIGECLFSFQEPEVVQLISKVTGLQDLEADPTLYASGVSVLVQGDFLRPHLDNSHDGDGRRYRVLNLLFYATPDWEGAHGGNLELWDPRVRRCTTIVSQFNRLVVMETHHKSWHSVNRVLAHRPRTCLSNYYFSPRCPRMKAYSQVTTFTGRPGEPLVRIFLKADGILRNWAGRMLPNSRRRAWHRLENQVAG